MNEIWANRLTAGTKGWEEVPVSRRNAVKNVLRSRVDSETITPEQYAEITGEAYSTQD